MDLDRALIGFGARATDAVYDACDAWRSWSAWQRAAAIFVAFWVLLLLVTAFAIHAPPSFLPDDPRALSLAKDPVARIRFTDRNGIPLNETRLNAWNLDTRLALHDVPPLLRNAILTAEDQRFFEHHGADWRARANAAVQNIKALRVVRGASTISEQSVRMLHPRRRSLWSRWIEGWEAMWLEARFGKPAVLEFYLNQVPYAAQRRGVVQASRYYFGRDPDTLNERETLTLAVLIRSPAGMAAGITRHPDGRENARLSKAVRQLAIRMQQNHMLAITPETLAAENLSRPINNPDGADTSAFLQALRAWPNLPAGETRIRTTLDTALQTRAQQLLESELQQDADLDVHHAALLVVDWRRNEILAWTVVSNAAENATQIDAVRVPRQPGSALKPLVYAAAFEKGWTPSTMILDAPLEQLVGSGMHEYNNYSRLHYGWISAREALGNSLNVPAVKAVQFVGTPSFLDTLRAAGIASLRGHPNLYGDGIALGNGEITLYELVSAYATLARGGVWKPFTPFASGDENSAATNVNRAPPRRVFRAETASLIADILSDDNAREKEFGAHGVLDFPVQTAVKTGTSSDYRDAWTVAFNDCCVVGAWFGNLDYRPMHEITGARGPAPVVRGVVAAINRQRDTLAFVRHPALRAAKVCTDTGLQTETGSGCESRDEWFAPWMTPGAFPDGDTRVRIRKPGPGLRLAMDPRIPDADEGFEMLLQAPSPVAKVEWIVDGRTQATTTTERWVWPVQRGEHRVQARVWIAGKNPPMMPEAKMTAPTMTDVVPFLVR